jgi:hypothetical protein
MPLDLHIVGSEAGPFHVQPVLQIDPDSHGELFYSGRIARKAFPLLARLEDYHEDATYLTSELQALKDEVLLVLPSFKGAPTATHTLEQLLNVIEVTSLNAKTLVFLAD